MGRSSVGRFITKRGPVNDSSVRRSRRVGGMVALLMDVDGQEFVDRKDAGISHSGSYLATSLAPIIKGTLLPVAAAVRLRPEIPSADKCARMRPIKTYRRIVIVVEQMG